MLITFFSLALLAPLSSEASLQEHGNENSHSHMLRQSEYQHRVTLYSMDADLLRFGLQSYCDLPYNKSEVGRHQYMIEDCVKLIDLLAGEDNYKGYWMVMDHDCSPNEDYWWITVAGWGTCNFAMVVPTCGEPYTT